jgi:SAM-dependent methyltransferase
MFKGLLSHPLGRGVDLDDPQATLLRRQILVEKRFLRHLYVDWYRSLVQALPAGDGAVLELGTGAGFLRDLIPGLITSDVLHIPDLDVVLDAHHLPFRSGMLRAVVMIDVLHHLSEPTLFFREAARCVRPGGAVVMIEPWVTPWSRLVYTLLHHEPFHPEADQWGFPPSGPLSGANGALPWIIFHRDRERFDREYPEWHVKTVEPDMPVSYLLSGGVSMRSFAPGWMFGLVRGIERSMTAWMDFCAMFVKIQMERSRE